MDTAEQYVCKQPKCEFVNGGPCLEALPPPDMCPFRSLASSETDSHTEEKTDVTKEPINEKYHRTHTGEALNIISCDALMASTPVKFIMLAGLKDSGKSTLLGSLMQMFQDNHTFAGCYFAGSESIIGFDKICHDSRFNSGRSKPETTRTVKGFKDFLHIKIKTPDPSDEKIDLVFTNISGEDFKDLTNSTENCKSFTLASRANHFVLFLDADGLSDNSKRHAIRASSIDVLMGLLDAGVIHKNAKIDIIFSRWDLLQSKGNKNDLDFIELIKADLLKRLTPYNFKPDFFEIASRPETTTDILKFGYGLDALFTEWVNSSSLTEINFNKTIPSRKPLKEFSKYTF